MTWIQWQAVLDGVVHIGSAPTGVIPGQFVTQHFVGANGQSMTYYLFTPPHYQPAQRYPLILVLHGTGERARPSNTAAQNRDAVVNQHYVQALVAPSVQTKWPSFVVVPQIMGTSGRWVDASGGQGSYQLQAQPTSWLLTAMNIVVTLQAHFSAIDHNRLYATGTSMGAFGVWDVIERWPGMFAAAAPLAGAGDPSRATDLVHVPIWDFHGAADTNVPVASSRQMYAAVHAAGGSSCYTEFPGRTHDVWNTVQVYAQLVFQVWLFSQTRAPSTARGQPLWCAGQVIDGVPAVG